MSSLFLKKLFFLQKGEREMILHSSYLIFFFFLFPSHYHSCLKLSDVNQVWPSLYFLSKNMWWPEKSPLWPPSNHSYAFFFSYIDMILKEMKRKIFLQSSTYLSIFRYIFLHRKHSCEFLSFHETFYCDTDNVTALALSRGKVICCWEIMWRVPVGCLFRANAFQTQWQSLRVPRIPAKIKPLGEEHKYFIELAGR